MGEWRDDQSVPELSEDSVRVSMTVQNPHSIVRHKYATYLRKDVDDTADHQKDSHLKHPQHAD